MSKKKKPSARRSVRGEAPEAQPITQAAAARPSAETELRTLIDRLAPAHRRLISTMRSVLRKQLPAAHEVVYEYRDFFVISYSPNDRGYEGVLAIRANKDGAKLYFNRGKELPDPENLLRGSGGLVRSIDVPGASTLARPPVVSLIDEAIARSPVTFAASSRGTVVIRMTKARKSRSASARKTKRKESA